jgi:hypothetical protein
MSDASCFAPLLFSEALEGGSLSIKIDNIYKTFSFFTQDHSRKIDFGHL